MCLCVVYLFVCGLRVCVCVCLFVCSCVFLCVTFVSPCAFVVLGRFCVRVAYLFASVCATTTFRCGCFAYVRHGAVEKSCLHMCKSRCKVYLILINIVF